MQKKKPTQKQQTADKLGNLQSGLMQLEQGLQQLGQLAQSNSNQHVLLIRALTTKLNEVIESASLDVEPITQQTYVEIGEQWEALTKRPDFKDQLEDWFNGRAIETYVAPEPEAETNAAKPETLAPTDTPAGSRDAAPPS